LVYLPFTSKIPVTRIGITGLSQAGKSTLITAVINHLENIRRGALAKQTTLSGLTHGHWLRDATPAFDYDAGLHALTNSPPSWPNSTTDWSIARIELSIDRPWYSTKPRRRIIELLDYPGEWLLDLCLLEWDYPTFCAQVWSWCSQAPRAAIAADLIQTLAAIDPQAPVDAAYLLELQQRWAAFLADSRLPPYQLSRNLPGRFLLNGAHYHPEHQPFIPLFALNLSSGGGAPKFPAHSWGAVCTQNYLAYRDHEAKPFFSRHFQSLDAQVILIDLLGAMTAGSAALKDMRAALEGVLQPFTYGTDHWLGRLFRRKIRRVAVCATKMDHLLPDDQKRLQSLAESYLYDTVQRLAAESIELKVMAIAAVQAARIQTEANGEQSLIGRDKRTGQAVQFTPPALPQTMPHNLNLKIGDLPQLAPPPGLDRAHPFPGRRIDQLLAFLLAD
jgi:predicted YcjX-like family ATPase